MKTFTRHRTLKEFKTECRERGWKVHTKKFEEGSDYIGFDWTVGSISGTALFSVVNGRFFGQLSKGERFSSDDTDKENKRWFNALLRAAYV